MSGFGDVLSAAAEVEAFCRGQGWRFCFIGGIAVHRWGTPRFTQDVDLTLLTGYGGEEPIVDALLTRFAARVRDARRFALERRVVLAQSASGVALDIALGALAFEEAATARATAWKANDHTLTTCSAEDLIIQKVFAGRDRDWGDAESVLARQHGQLDLGLIRRELEPLMQLKEDMESLGQLERLIAKVDRRIGH